MAHRPFGNDYHARTQGNGKSTRGGRRDWPQARGGSRRVWEANIVVTESSEHQELVEELVEAAGCRWPATNVCWDSEWAGWGGRRIQVGKYTPDVTVAEKKTGRLLALGEAKRWDDIDTEHTAEQLKEWLCESEVPICLAMSRGHLERMEDAVEVATGIETGCRFYIYDGLKWWTREAGTLASWRRER